MQGEELIAAQKTAKKNLLWVGIASIVMMFAGLTSAYVVLQKDHYWVKTDLPSMFLYSTIIIALSSISMWWALKSLKADNYKAFKNGILITLLLGFTFSLTQYLGWQELVSEGKFFVGHIGDLEGTYGEDYVIMQADQPMLFANDTLYAPTDIDYSHPLNDRINASFNVSGSFLYILSGVHLVHLAGGLLAMMVVLFKAFKKRYSPTESLGVEIAAIYWHFLDILWIYLYLFLLFIR